MKINRLLYRILILLSFLAVNAFILMGVSAVLSYLNTGADRSTILHLPEELSPSYTPKVEWSSDINEGRPMESQTRMEIERDYLKAWQVRNVALATNNRYGIADYYTDSARIKLYDILDFNKNNDTHFKSTTLRHHLTLEFYSADGKMAVLTDKNVALYEEAHVANELLARETQTASYQVIMLLEDGFWRIRHLVKLSSENRQKEKISKLETDAITKIKGINYYPQRHPWNMYGSTFDADTLRNDFQKIKAMGLNTIRIFIPYEAFGKAEIASQKVDQLLQTLDLADKNDLKVILTLFDFYGDYRVQDWTLTHRHAEHIVSAVKNHDALLAWDIKNEPDLDFDTRGRTRVVAWLEQMIQEVKHWDPEHPVTIGWSSPEATETLSDKVDFVSFHYYREPSQFADAFDKLQRNVNDKPIVLQEYGYSSYDGLWNAYLGSEEDQAEYFKEMQEVLQHKSIPYLFWTLYDFESVPNSVVGKLPWRKAQQQHFGLFTYQGKTKKAYHAITGKDK